MIGSIFKNIVSMDHVLQIMYIRYSCTKYHLYYTTDSNNTLFKFYSVLYK